MQILNFHNKKIDDLLAKLKQQAVRDGVAGLYPPISLANVRACEKWFGFKLPVLLTRVYSEVANGGIGPGGQLVGLNGGKGGWFNNENYVLDALGIYEAFVNYSFGWDEQDDYGDYLWQWPSGLLPIADWGHYELTVLDCRSRNAKVIRLNYRASINYKEAWQRKNKDVLRFPETTLAQWLASSIDGTETEHIPKRSESWQLRELLGWQRAEPRQSLQARSIEQLDAGLWEFARPFQS